MSAAKDGQISHTAIYLTRFLQCGDTQNSSLGFHLPSIRKKGIKSIASSSSVSSIDDLISL
jgi:hypothetical protein